jgi:TctA family transporter
MLDILVVLILGIVLGVATGLVPAVPEGSAYRSAGLVGQSLKELVFIHFDEAVHGDGRLR